MFWKYLVGLNTEALLELLVLDADESRPVAPFTPTLTCVAAVAVSASAAAVPLDSSVGTGVCEDKDEEGSMVYPTPPYAVGA